jgi:hypothetical protein
MTQTAKKIVNRINTPSLAKLFANKNTEVNDVVPTNEVNVPKIETTNLSVNNATQTNYSVPQNSQISKVNTLAKSFDNKFSRISGIQLKEETIPDNLQADTDGKYRRKSADGSIQFESD